MNLLRVLSATLVGLIMMPYVNRILGASYVGKVEYANTIISYFLMFSALGIPVYGVREIAKVRDDVKKRTLVLIELLFILFITCIIAYLALFLIIGYFQLFADYKELLIILSSMILLTNIGAEWYFQGMENQTYITIRYVIVRLITLLILFFFVKMPEDYLIYAIILVLNFSGSYFFNLFFIFKSIDLKNISLKDIKIKRHLKPVFVILIAAVSVNIYSLLDSFLIGYLVGDKYLGYYSVANKLIRYSIAFIVMIGTVTLPRLSMLWGVDNEKYYILLRDTFNYLMLFSIPMVGFFILFSKNLIFLMAGSDFEEAQLTLQILAPLCLIVTLAYYFGYLVLYTQSKDKLYTITVIISAIVSVIMNFFMIKRWNQDGAAFTQVFVEFLAVVVMILFIKKEIIKMKILNFNLLKIFSGTIFASLIFVIFQSEYPTSIFNLTILMIAYFSLIILLLLIFKEATVTKILTMMKIKFSRNTSK